MGKDVMQTGERLGDVAEGCVLRMVEDGKRRRGGEGGGEGGRRRERERNSLLTSKLQLTSVQPERERETEHTMTD